MIERVERFLAAVMGVLSGDYDQVIGVSKHTGHGWEFGGPENFVDQKVEERWTERAALGSTIVKSVVIREDTLELDSSLSVGEEVPEVIAWMIESLLASSNAFSRSRKTAGRESTFAFIVGWRILDKNDGRSLAEVHMVVAGVDPSRMCV